MSRSYKAVRPKVHRVYSVDELMILYSVSRNTVTNWIKGGLAPSDGKQPYVFRGAVVKRFHSARRERFRVRLLTGEFNCLRCKAAVRPALDHVKTRQIAKGRALLLSSCPDCHAHVTRLASRADLAFWDGSPVPNTSKDCPHEPESAPPARIGNSGTDQTPPDYLRNDRIIAAWQLYAARHSAKTQDRHLAAIRQFEVCVRGKWFKNLKQEDVNGFRDHMRKALSARSEKARSKSTVAHTLSHVQDFLVWLLKQKEFDSLPRDLPDYLQLSRGEYAEALPCAHKACPQIEEALKMLAAMPKGTRVERRGRAIFATAFLGALRADTLVSLRLCHILPAERIIVQNGSISRTKNDKSLRVRWFPLPEAFERELRAWLEELVSLGATPDDALFPPQSWLIAPGRVRKERRTPVPVMTSIHAVAAAFKAASRAVGNARYTPHAAKHTIGTFCDRLPLTEEQRKAWSQNMGHKTRAITEIHYGKLSDERCGELFEEMVTGVEQVKSAELSGKAFKGVVRAAEEFLAAVERGGFNLNS